MKSPIKSKWIVLCKYMAWYAVLGMVEAKHSSSSITMMVNSDMSQDEIKALFDNKDTFLCLTTSMNKMKYSDAMSNMIRERIMVQELVPGSDPDLNRVRISDTITMSISNAVISALKSVSNVPVFVGQREITTETSILLSSVKLNELLGMYQELYAFSHSAWRNLPTLPDCESVFVLMWMISADDYDVNHFTIKWPGATSNTFVHLWSIIDRLRTVLETNSADWLVGPRNPVGYSSSMNMPGAADEYLYPSESIIPPHIEVFSDNMSKMKPKSMKRDYDSNFSFTMSLMLPKPRHVIDSNKMAMRNHGIAFSMRNKAEDEDKH
ncbi:hypothetical protein LTR95_006904 [Oleoguttula sp. CCFEE 5521]